MTLIEFQTNLEKEYSFNKFFNYASAIFFLFGGLFFIYKILLTNWTTDHNMSVGLILFSLFLSFYMIYFGIFGFLRTPKVTEIHMICKIHNIENLREKIIETSQKLNLFLIPTENNTNCILKFETKNILLEKKDLLIFYNKNGIYANVQQRNWNGPSLLGYRSSIKLIRKLQNEFKNLS